MSHRHHLVCLVAAVGLGVVFLVAGTGGLAFAGLSLALLICPLVMGGVMWFLMRQPQAALDRSDAHEEHASAGPQ
jgi:hypothetical protein